MPIYKVQTPDGQTLKIEGPDGATDDQLIRVAKGHLDQQRMADPLSGVSTGEKFLAGAGKAFTDIARGAGQLVGLGPSREDVAEQRRLDAPLMSGAGTAGNIVGNIAATVPAAFVPGVNTYAGGALLGAGMGALQPVANESRTGNMAMGAGAGVAGTAAARGVGRLLSPQTRPDVKTLMSEGVTPTPGQILGGAANRMEQAATSIPMLGDVIQNARRGATESLNKAALQRSLTPIGGNVTNIGREGVREVGEKLGQAYDDLLPRLAINADQQFSDDLSRIVQNSSLPKAEADQLISIVTNKVKGKFSQGAMSGETMKAIESELGRLSRGYTKDSSFDKRELGYAIQEVQASLRSMVERANPQFSGELRKINEGWANFLRVQRAAGASGSKEGVFSPEALRGSVRALDPSRNKGSFARGDALMQDLASAGENVLGRTVPDSGTPFRLANIGMVGAVPFVDPVIPAALAGSAALYTPPAQRLLANLLTQRPDMVRSLAPQVRRLGILGGPVYAGQE